MPIDTPRWVRDAVFYQVFPDRFARSGRVPKPRTARGVGRAADGDTASRAATCYGVAEHLDHIADLGANAIYLNPIFASAVEPSLPHVRLLRGRPAARRRRRAPRAARRRARARDPGRPRRRVQPLRPRVLAVPPRPRERRGVARTATGSTSTRASSSRAGRSAPTRRRRAGPRAVGRRPRTATGRRPSATSATRRGGTCPRCPSSTPEPGGARVPARRRRALDPVRRRRLAARRARGDRRRRLLARVPAAHAGPSTPRPTSWPRSGREGPTGCAATSTTRMMNYPFG